MMLYDTNTLKKGKLTRLREVSLTKAMETEIFSQNLIKVPKINLNPKKTQTPKFTFKSARCGQQIKNIISNQVIRKQTENIILTLSEYQNKMSKFQNENNSFLYTSFGAKSITSTNANTQRSQNINLSDQQNSDEKRIINGSQNYSEAQTLKNSCQNLSIDDFNILNFCGQGAFGSVYIAQHKLTGSLFALKKILKATVSDLMDRQSLIREMKIHYKLNHPNIIKFYGAFSTQKAIYFIMELCSSGNLYQKLRQQGPFCQTQVKSIIRQVCKGLDYLHENNIIHRDIKAQNIIIHEKVVKICDFGWASQGQYSRKSLCGTPAYISPQVVQNKLYDKKIDVWSMGILTFELIFGKIPFDIKSQEDLRKIVEEQLKFPHERTVSQQCKQFIMKCLQKDSFKRWDTSRLLKHQFLKKQ